MQKVVEKEELVVIDAKILKDVQIVILEGKFTNITVKDIINLYNMMGAALQAAQKPIQELTKAD